MAQPFRIGRLVLPLLFFALSTSVYSDQDAPSSAEAEALEAGHSAHGEVFNEGPRQAAHRMNGTGPIRFEVSSEHPDVQKFVEQGIGQLHGFWYFEAERSFRQAAMLDSDCAICYWGMALANDGNSTRAKKFLEEALARRGHASEREAMYIDALNDHLNGKGDKKEKAKRQIALYEAIAERYPDDLEAKAWLGYALYKQRGNAGKSYEDVDAALKTVLKEEPLHPVHHYRIHLWDYKDSAMALDSASKCGAAAPDIAHMWHMPGHIYSRLKRYEDAAWQQEASARTDHRNMMHDRVMPDEIHNFAHNNEWLIRNLICVGRWQDAIDLAKNMIELPRHPKYNSLSKRKSAYYGRTRLFGVLKNYECWSELIALTDSPYLEPTDDDVEQIRRLQHRGVAFAHLRRVDDLQIVLADLNQRLQKGESQAAEEKRKHEEAVAQAKNEDKKPPAKKKSAGEESVERLEKAIASIEGRLEVEYGEFKSALPLLKKAGEDKSYIAYIQLQAGEKEAALKAIADEVKSSENEVYPLAVQTEMLWMAGEKEEAKKALETLRSLSGSIQYGAAPFDRLTPIAEEFGYSADWKAASKVAEDFGERPELDSLGPFRWAPQPAPAWQLKDHAGKQHALQDYSGKPVVVMFYLGFGCLHCAEQLQAFIPMHEKFQQAGISLIAISSDDAAGLKLSLKNYDGEMPFPLVENESLDIFKAYRAYDDFEQTPLHGTYLIDGQGRVLWQDIGYEPFMDVNFVLEESQRLLNQAKPLPQLLAAGELPERPRPPAIKLADLPRIDPIGVGGSLVLAGADIPESALEMFFRLAHGEAAKGVVLSVDDSDITKAITQRLLDRWSASDGAELRIIRVNNEDRIASLDWKSLLADATGVWVAANDAERITALAQDDAARAALTEFVANGNVIGVAGEVSSLFASTSMQNSQSDKFISGALALLPDAIIDIHSAAQESPALTEKVIEQQPHLIGYELEPDAAMVVQGRRIFKVGEGALRIRRAAAKADSPEVITLSGERDFADLTALRRAARDHMAGYPGGEEPPAVKVDSGTLIMIGGGGMPKGIISRFVQLAGGKDSHIVVLPTAMEDPIPEQNGIVEEFRKAGAGSVTVLPGRTLNVVEGEESLAALKKATGIWFGGGRQWRFVDAYLDTEAHQLMHDVLRRGGVIMGSSAGASIQADFLARGNPLGNLDIMAEGYQRGLKFLPGVAIDQHFTQRSRQADMRSLVERHPRLLGIGLDEATALIVQGEVGEITGRGKVHFHIAGSGETKIEVTSLAAGQRYDLANRRELSEPADPDNAPVEPPMP